MDQAAKVCTFEQSWALVVFCFKVRLVVKKPQVPSSTPEGSSLMLD